MGTGYTRNDTANNIADGNVINAADFDGEYDAIEAAFNSSTGHTHDGTASEGGAITVLGPSQNFVASSASVAPSTNAGLDLGTTSLKFKDLYIDGTAYIDGLGGDLLIATTNKIQFRDAQLFINSSADGQLDLEADTTIELTAPEVVATDNVTLKSDASVLSFGTDSDVTVTHVADTGLDAKAASGFALKLQTGDTTVENGNTIGKISFNAPSEASGSDAILVGAEIEAAAEDTFDSTTNSMALIFKTNTSAAATERMRIKSDGDIVLKGASIDVTWDTSANSLDFPDNAIATFGTGDDLIVKHDGTNSSLVNTTGEFILEGDGITLRSNTGTETYVAMDLNGGVELYYDNSKKLETTTDGVDITGDLDVDNINVDGNTISSTNTNGDINLSPNGTGTVVINTDLDVDNININGNSITSTDTNGDISITPNGTGKVNISGGFVPSEINLTSTDAGASAGPIFELHRNSASPTDNDAIGAIDFAGQDSGGNKNIYASIDATIMDATDATEDTRLDFIAMTAGSNYSRMRLDPTQTVFNEAGADIDFKIEGDTVANMFYVDASTDRIGIGTDTPDTTLEISTAGSGTTDVLKLVTTGSNTVPAILFEADISGSQHNAARLTVANAAGTDGGFIFEVEDNGSLSEAVRINSVGNVGVGTTSPDPSSLGFTNLTVKDTGTNSSGTVTLHGSTTADNTAIGIIDFYNNDGTASIARIEGQRQNANNSGDIVFKTAAAGTLAEALVIDYNGDADFPNTLTAARGVGDTLTDTSNTGSVTLNFEDQQNFVLTLTGNVTLANPTTETVGQSGFIAFIQDGTGSRTVSLGTDYETAGAAGLTLSTAASTTDLVPYLVVASNRILLGTPLLAFS